uniref:Odorant binding protein PBP3 n=1 Tax=Clostera restitura TaxID=2008422 RepID=A0A346FW86_9NEOP|nr:odorant binding protein PBP3 [Clostera restitura]
MGKTCVLTCVLLVVAGLKEVEPSKDAMKYITTGFVKVLAECRKELQLDDQIIVDLFHYWKLDYSLLNRNIGCLIICMSKKLDLIDESGRLHHGNAHEFAMNHGADADMASKLVEIIHSCEKGHDHEDECTRVLEVAKCFRTAIHELDWHPDMEVGVLEVLAEI